MPQAVSSLLNGKTVISCTKLKWILPITHSFVMQMYEGYTVLKSKGGKKKEYLKLSVAGATHPVPLAAAYDGMP